MLNGRIGGGVIVWHSFQSMVWAHSRRTLLFSINAWAHSPRAANHPKIVTIRALYRDPMPLILSHFSQQVLALLWRVQCSLITVSSIKTRLSLVRMRMHCTVWLMMSPAVEHHPVLIAVEHYPLLLVMVAVAMDEETGTSQMVNHCILVPLNHSCGMPDGWLELCSWTFVGLPPLVPLDSITVTF